MALDELAEHSEVRHRLRPQCICGGRRGKVTVLIRGGLPGCRCTHPPDEASGNARFDPAGVSRGQSSGGEESGREGPNAR